MLSKMCGMATVLVATVTVNGDARWSSRLSTGPLPVDAAWPAKPANASMARRPLAISFTLYFAKSLVLLRPSGSNGPPG